MGKYFDILPPQRKHILYKGKEEKGSYRKRPTLKYRKRRYGTLLAILFFGIILFFSFFSYYSKAEITVYPEKRIMKDKIDVLVSKDAEKISLREKIIPGSYVELVTSVSQEFNATGKASEGEKARGKIRVFNEYSTHSIPFRAKTRFMSAGGKIFISPERFVVPGKRFENGKWVPGTVDIEVEASQAGEDYNIGPTTFSIPGLSGTASYTYFYAKSLGNMEGGSSEKSFKVTKEDLEKAEEDTKNRLEQKQKDEIKDKENEERIYIFPGTISQEVTKEYASAKEGEVTTKFTYYVEGKVRGFSFKRDDLRKVVLSYINDRISDNEDINLNELSINWNVDKIEESKGQVLMVVSIEASIFKKISMEELKKYIRKKKIIEAEKMLMSHPGISKVSIKVIPSFIKKIPSRKERIILKVSLD